MPLPSSRGIAGTQILTLNGDFGAYLVPAGSGVVLNNSLSDFDNKVKPGGFGRASLFRRRDQNVGFPPGLCQLLVRSRRTIKNRSSSLKTILSRLKIRLSGTTQLPT